MSFYINLAIAEKWRMEYNYSRPHQALNNLSPIRYKKEKLLHLQW